MSRTFVIESLRGQVYHETVEPIDVSALVPVSSVWFDPAEGTTVDTLCGRKALVPAFVVIEHDDPGWRCGKCARRSTRKRT